MTPGSSSGLNPESHRSPPLHYIQSPVVNGKRKMGKRSIRGIAPVAQDIQLENRYDIINLHEFPPLPTLLGESSGSSSPPAPPTDHTWALLSPHALLKAKLQSSSAGLIFCSIPCLSSLTRTDSDLLSFGETDPRCSGGRSIRRSPCFASSSKTSLFPRGQSTEG